MSKRSEPSSDPILLDEPLNAAAFGTIRRTLGFAAVILGLLVGVGFFLEEELFRSRAIFEVLLVGALMAMLPLLFAWFLGQARTRLVLTDSVELSILVVFRDRRLRASRRALAEIREVEVRKLPPGTLPVPAGLRRVLLIAHLHEGGFEHLAQVGGLALAEEVASRLRSAIHETERRSAGDTTGLANSSADGG